MPEKKDLWDKLSIILQPVGGLLTALAVAAVGIFGSQFLQEQQQQETAARERMQALETNVRLYTELMSKREEAESALRKDMFRSIIDSFLRPGAASLEEKILNLELLTYNFHESLNLKPLFLHLKKQIALSHPRDAKDYISRLEKIAREVTRKQILILEGAGKKFDRTVDLDWLSKTPGGMELTEDSLKVGGIERQFRIFVLAVDRKNQELRIRLEITTPKGSSGEAERNIAEFSVGFFDFPMIDNTRLSNDQRCSIVLNAFDESSADITAVYFPGAYASLKEKPYYQEVVQSLIRSSKVLDEGRK